jgi:hypothetical protein
VAVFKNMSWELDTLEGLLQLTPGTMRMRKSDFSLIEDESRTIGMQVSTTRAAISGWLPALNVPEWCQASYFRLGRFLPP